VVGGGGGGGGGRWGGAGGGGRGRGGGWGGGGGGGAAAGRDSNWDVLEVLEFNSTRKRMSVIVRQKGGAGGLKILCKGADNVIVERLANSARNGKVLDMTQAHCETYAEEGLRTLFVAQADIAPAKFAAWQKRFQSAQADPAELAKRVALLPNRIDDVMDEIESGLQLLGATAIEDKLQDGVPPAIASLAKAGVKLWVLTGDKTETAINIAFACELLHNDMELIRADSSTCPDEDATAGFLASAADAAEMEDATLGSQSLARDGRGKAATPGSSSARSEEDDRSSLVGSSGGGGGSGGSGGTKRRRRTSLMAHTITATACQDRALVIDGPVLSHALRSEEGKAELLRLAVRCKAVVACRVSPKQKAEMVKLVQDNVPDVTSLAIGDGANDVPMIKAASVGVGISGQEGMQAVNNSDFAIAQFRFLAPLMLLHGRWNYGRLAKLVLYTFYKNFVYNIAMFRCGDATRLALPRASSPCGLLLTHTAPSSTSSFAPPPPRRRSFAAPQLRQLLRGQWHHVLQHLVPAGLQHRVHRVASGALRLPRPGRRG
jgi:phospholipid-transporting ATPase